jgi:hypothetical protein
VSIRWRRSFATPSKNKELLLSGVAPGSFIVSGQSNEVWPVVYVLFHNDTAINSAVNAKCLLYTFERAIQSLPAQKQEFALLIDTKGFGYNNVPPMTVISEMSEILAKHMPRRLGVVFVINVSYVVHWVYDMVSIAMSEVTRNKFRFISSNKEEMRRIIGEFTHCTPNQPSVSRSLTFSTSPILLSEHR